MDLDKAHLLEKALVSFQRSWGDVEFQEITSQEVKDEAYDAILHIVGGDFLCFIEPEVTTANYVHIKRKIERVQTEQAHVLLLSSYLPPSLYDDLKQAKINFMDSVGNYFIRLLDGARMIFQMANSGEKAPEKTPKSYPLFKEAGLKVVFYLLQDIERVNKPFRSIQSGSGVSIGTVKNVMDELRARGFLLTTKRGRRLKNTKQLLNAWAENYALVLKPKLLLQNFAFRSPWEREEWRTISLPHGMWWGGECAAAEKQGYLLPGEFTIYSEVLPAQLLRSGAVLMDQGEITLYKKFWLGDTMPMVLVYADLMTSGDSRNIEAAEKLLSHELTDFE